MEGAHNLESETDLLQCIMPQNAEDGVFTMSCGMVKIAYRKKYMFLLFSILVNFGDLGK